MKTALTQADLKFSLLWDEDEAVLVNETFTSVRDGQGARLGALRAVHLEPRIRATTGVGELFNDFAGFVSATVQLLDSEERMTDELVETAVAWRAIDELTKTKIVAATHQRLHSFPDAVLGTKDSLI